MLEFIWLWLGAHLSAVWTLAIIAVFVLWMTGVLEIIVSVVMGTIRFVFGHFWGIAAAIIVAFMIIAITSRRG